MSSEKILIIEKKKKIQDMPNEEYEYICNKKKEDGLIKIGKELSEKEQFKKNMDSLKQKLIEYLGKDFVNFPKYENDNLEFNHSKACELNNNLTKQSGLSLTLQGDTLKKYVLSMILSDINRKNYNNLKKIHDELKEINEEYSDQIDTLSNELDDEENKSNKLTNRVLKLREKCKSRNSEIINKKNIIYLLFFTNIIHGYNSIFNFTISSFNTLFFTLSVLSNYSYYFSYELLMVLYTNPWLIVILLLKYYMYTYFVNNLNKNKIE